MTCREEEKNYVVESDCKPEMKSDNNYYHNVVIQPPKGMGVAREEECATSQLSKGLPVVVVSQIWK